MSSARGPMPRTRHWCGTASSASYRRTISVVSADLATGIIPRRARVQDAGWGRLRARPRDQPAPATARGRDGRGRSAAILRWRSPKGDFRRCRGAAGRAVHRTERSVEELPFTQPCRSHGRARARATPTPLRGTPGPGWRQPRTALPVWLGSLSLLIMASLQIASRRSSRGKSTSVRSSPARRDPARLAWPDP